MTFPDYPKPTIFALLATLTVLPSWQVAEAAQLEGGRHSLIHRPQVHSHKLAPSPTDPSAATAASSPAQSLTRKIVRRPSTPSAAVAEVSPAASSHPAQTDPSQSMTQPVPDDDATEPELEPAPQE